MRHVDRSGQALLMWYFYRDNMRLMILVWAKCHDATTGIVSFSNSSPSSFRWHRKPSPTRATCANHEIVCCMIDEVSIGALPSENTNDAPPSWIGVSKLT